MATKDTEYVCKLCKVTVGSQVNLEQHLTGKKHLYMESQVNENKVDDCGTETDQIVDETSITGSRCELCNINAGNKVNLAQHLSGKKHAIMVAQLNLSNKEDNCDPVKDADATENHGDTVECFPRIISFDYQAIQFMAQHEIPFVVRNAKCMKLCGDIEACLQRVYRNGVCIPFGSIVTGLANEESDIDLYFNANFQQTSDAISINGISRSTEQQIVKAVKNILGRFFPTFQSVFAIPTAKVALVKLYHMPTQVNCDLSFKNGVGVNNSALIKFYLSVDPRIKPLMMVLKHWGKVYELTGTGHITNYALVWMVLYYLQQLEEPIVPMVAALQSTNDCKRYVNGWDCSFITLQWLTRNQSTIQQLLVGFFRFYAHFDHELFVICPLLGCLLPKSIFCHVEKLPPEMKTLKEKLQKGESQGLRVASKFCVQDPFVLEHNVTFSMSRNLIEKFQELCSAAESICGSTQQLKMLFEDCGKLVKPKKQRYCEVALFSCKKFAEKLAEAPVDNCAAEDLKHFWYTTVYESLVDVLENVLKLDVCDVDSSSEGTAAKVRKLYSSSDVSNSSCSNEEDFYKMRIIQCSTFFRVWDVHKVSSKDFYKLKAESGKVNCAQKMNAIEQQKAITNFIMENFSQYFDMQQPDEKNSVLAFTCQFLPKQNPIHVLLKFSCDSRENLDFTSLMIFLKKYLPKWIQES